MSSADALNRGAGLRRQLMIEVEVVFPAFHADQDLTNKRQVLEVSGIDRRFDVGPLR